MSFENKNNNYSLNTEDSNSSISANQSTTGKTFTRIEVSKSAELNKNELNLNGRKKGKDDLILGPVPPWIK